LQTLKSIAWILTPLQLIVMTDSLAKLARQKMFQILGRCTVIYISTTQYTFQ
jgi:hypothetical protein